MSDTSSLTELARFIGQSGVIASGAANRASIDGVAGLALKPAARPRVSELLSVVLTLSARTRRMVLPRVEIDIDVFAPGGERAVRMILPE